MPSGRIQSAVANGRVGYNTLNARVSNLQTGILTPGVTTTLTPGMPIGLLLALTYATDMSTTSAPVYNGDMRPNSRLTTY